MPFLTQWQFPEFLLSVIDVLMLISAINHFSLSYFLNNIKLYRPTQNSAGITWPVNVDWVEKLSMSLAQGHIGKLHLKTSYLQEAETSA